LANLPAVNLLPPEFGERKRLQQIQAGVALVVLLAVGVVGYVDYSGRQNVHEAKQQLANATSEQGSLTRELAKYDQVKLTQSQLQASEALLTQSMATEVQWSNYLADLSTLLPANTWLTKLTINESLPAGGVLSPSQPAGQIGTMTLQGEAIQYNDLASWLDALAKEGGLANVYFSTASENYIGDKKVVDFQGSSEVTADALSARCAKPGVC
jgi:Tfp pilus assembly protein PilN